MKLLGIKNTYGKTVYFNTEMVTLIESTDEGVVEINLTDNTCIEVEMEIELLIAAINKSNNQSAA